MGKNKPRHNPDNCVSECDVDIIDNDFIKGIRLTNQESLALMFQDIAFDEKAFEKVVEKYVKLK